MPDFFSAFEWYVWPLLFFAGFAGGLVDSIAGGGGLITLPALLLTGMDPKMALGTNKFQSSFGSLTSSSRYIMAGEVKGQRVPWGVFMTLVGAASGTVLVQMLNTQLLTKLIPFLLLAIFIYTLVRPKLGEVDKDKKLPEMGFYAIFGLSIGFYDGFFGPGTGSFWTIAFVSLLGYNLKKATTHTKVMNFTSNVVSLIVFLIGGYVNFVAGIAMALGEVLGARLGAGLVIKRGTKFIRPIFITMVGLVMLKLFWDQFFAG
ncbi:MAG: TSUP family transporter [Planctomycetota bacterium]|nr:TSUP family transporter [Planctomycetota bacterium]